MRCFGKIHGMTSSPNLDQMTPDQLRTLAAQLLSKVDTMGRKIHRDETIIERLSHEIAILKRHKFAKRSEQISTAQGSLLDDLLNTDLEAVEAELNALRPATASDEIRQKPKRAPLPPQFPRTVIRHEPENIQCACGCQLQRIGEDVSEKLDYTPGVFTVEQHVRGKWACRQCGTLIQAPVPAQVIDKGIPTAGLLAHVMVAKFSDHLPLYRQEKIFGLAGLAIPRSTLAQWAGQIGVQLQPLVDALREVVLAQRVVHADETPVQMLAPGEKKTHRAYVWAYCTTPFSALKAVVYDFSPSRAGEHARNFLGTWNGKLVCDDFAGYKASFELGITEIGCMAHARRKFFDLHMANKSQLAEQALHSRQWRERHARGDVIVVRYADDSVVGFRTKVQAQQFLEQLRERLARFGLSLNTSKTRLIEFGRFAARNCRKRSLGKPKTFDFLGFTHCCSTNSAVGFRYCA